MAGKATPIDASTMWNPSVKAICSRAGSSWDEAASSREELTHPTVSDPIAAACGGVGCAHGAHPHLLSHHGHRPLGRLLRGARLPGGRTDPDPRRGGQRVHEPAGRRRRAAPRADLQLRRRQLRPRVGLRPHRDHRGRPRSHPREPGRAGDRAREAAIHRPRRRQPAVLRARPGRLPGRAHRAVVGPTAYAAEVPDASRVAVIDLGSNSFRLVVFSSIPGRWWRRTDEIYEPVRIGAGEGETGALQPAPMERALHTIEAYAHFCRASGLGLDEVQAVATSAIREAFNREEFLSRAYQVSGLPVRILSRDEEARYGYLAAVNSTTLADGAMLDLGGGSVQVVGVEQRRARRLGSWPLGAVRMTEQFLAEDAPASRKQLKALRAHVRDTLAKGAGWLAATGERLVGIGGAVRNLAAAAQRRAGLPSFGGPGVVLGRRTP